MKQLLLTLALMGFSALAHAQGTIAFQNSALTRVQFCPEVRTIGVIDPIPSLQIVVGVWYGTSADNLVQAHGTAQVGFAGVSMGASSVYAIPGTEPGQTVALQIRAWNHQGLYGQTKVAQVTLGPTEGPGTVIWQTADGQNLNRLTPLVICIPEPSSLALGLLALVVGLVSAWRRLTGGSLLFPPRERGGRA